MWRAGLRIQEAPALDPRRGSLLVRRDSTLASGPGERRPGAWRLDRPQDGESATHVTFPCCGRDKVTRARSTTSITPAYRTSVPEQPRTNPLLARSRSGAGPVGSPLLRARSGSADERPAACRFSSSAGARLAERRSAARASEEQPPRYVGRHHRIGMQLRTSTPRIRSPAIAATNTRARRKWSASSALASSPSSGVGHVGAARNNERRIELLASILDDAAQQVVRCLDSPPAQDLMRHRQSNNRSALHA